ncbi:hypothetical protein GCM10020331_075930 [Ectobacillus funiculus]
MQRIFIVEDNQLKPTAVGKGLLDYDVVIRLIKIEKKPFVNILMEETTEPFIEESIEFLRDKYKSARDFCITKLL